MEQVITFDPTVEQLQTIVASTKELTAGDLPKVHEARMFLRDSRVKIEKKGKEYRAEALAYQKAVIAREKELIAIIEPEEVRLKGIEDAAEAARERAARAPLLPMRREHLAKFEHVLSDDAILDMDNNAFFMLLTELQAKKNEADRLAIEAEKARLAREADHIDREDQERKTIESEKRYYNWLAKIGYSNKYANLWYFSKEGGTIKAYKYISTFQK